MKFGIGLRDKQKLNLDRETKTCGDSDWIDTSHGHSYNRGWRVRQLWVVTTEQGCRDPHLNATCFSYRWRMMDDDAMPYRSCARLMKSWCEELSELGGWCHYFSLVFFLGAFVGVLSLLVVLVFHFCAAIPPL